MQQSEAHTQRGSFTASYIDAVFESMVDDVSTHLDLVNDAHLHLNRTAKADAIREQVYMLCRLIRETKLEYERVLQAYGVDYEDQGQRFVDLAVMASEIADGSPFAGGDVRESLRRHATEIQIAQTEVCEYAA